MRTPVDELRRVALAASPPMEPDARRSSDLVELVALDPSIKLDIRYATARNFLSGETSSRRARLIASACATQDALVFSNSSVSAGIISKMSPTIP